MQVSQKSWLFLSIQKKRKRREVLRTWLLSKRQIRMMMKLIRPNRHLWSRKARMKRTFAKISKKNHQVKNKILSYPRTSQSQQKFLQKRKQQKSSFSWPTNQKKEKNSPKNPTNEIDVPKEEDKAFIWIRATIISKFSRQSKVVLKSSLSFR